MTETSAVIVVMVHSGALSERMGSNMLLFYDYFFGSFFVALVGPFGAWLTIRNALSMNCTKRSSLGAKNPVPRIMPRQNRDSIGLVFILALILQYPRIYGN